MNHTLTRSFHAVVKCPTRIGNIMAVHAKHPYEYMVISDYDSDVIQVGERDVPAYSANE
jgi:hypothetical protein